MPRANIDVDTGAGEIGAGLAGLGGALFEIGQKIKNSNMILENAKAERQYETSMNAAFETIKSPSFDPFDEDSIAKLKQKTEESMLSYQSKYSEVNVASQARYDGNYAQWDTKFKGLLEQKRAGKVEDEKVALEQYYYETGDVFKFARLQNSLVATGQQGRKEADNKITDFQKNSALAQARIAIGNNNPQGAITMLQDLKGLSGEQLDQRDKLLRIANETLKGLNDGFGKEILSTILKSANVSAPERANIALQLKQQIAQSNFSDTEARTWFDYIEKWEQGKDVQSDRDIYRALMRKAYKPDSYGGVDAVETAIVDARNDLSKQDTEELLDLTRREFEKSQSEAISEAEDYGAGQLIDYRTSMDLEAILKTFEAQSDKDKVIDNRKLQLWNHSRYVKALNDWQKKHPEATSDEIYAESRKLLVFFRKPAEQLKTELTTEEKRISTVPEIVDVKPRRQGETVEEYLKRVLVVE